MGLIDRFIGGDDDDDDEFDDDFEFDADLEIDDVEDTFDDEPDDEFDEDEPQRWDTAYEFLDYAIQQRGFSGMNEFIKRGMVYRINNSAIYRDRIAIGSETMGMIHDTFQSMEDLGEGGTNDYEQLASQLEGANKLVSEVEEFTNQEDQMVWGILQTAQEGIDVLRERAQVGSDIDTSVNVSQEEL